MSSPINYWGGKHHLAPQIISMMPAHSLYIEPFCGGGKVLFAKPKVKCEIINDLSKRVYNLFKVLRDPKQNKLLKESLILTPYSEEEHCDCINNPDSSDAVEAARRYFVSLTQSFSGRPGDSWAFSVKAGRSRAGETVAKIDRLHTYVDRLRSVQIMNRDALELLAKERDYGLHLDQPGAVIYVDPPYVHKTRQMAHLSSYDHEMTDEQHAQMLDTLRMYEHAKVIISGYACDLYRNRLKGWSRTETTISCHSVHRFGGEKKPTRQEVIWSNF